MMLTTPSASDVLLGRYRLIRQIGEGGMATVWLAADLRHDRQVAVKFLRTELSMRLGPERFLREVHILAQLQHPHILTLIDSGSSDGRLFFVMPYVEGETLRERIQRQGRLGVAETARILTEVLDALAYAHARGILHRDLKPENVILSGRHALVMDFGVAKALSDAAGDDRLTSTGMSLGTPRYMAPEQAAGDEKVDHRADVYGIGVLAYEMLSGEPPFSDVSGAALIAAHVTRAPEPLSPKCPGLPAGVGDAVMRALQKDSMARWQSAEDMRSAVLPFANEADAVTSPGNGSARRSLMTLRPLTFASAVALGALVVAGLWLAKGGSASEAEWARATGIQSLRDAIDDGRLDEAWALAERIRGALPDDSVLLALEPRYAAALMLNTSPAGARVSRRAYAGPDTTWTLVGVTPLDRALVPRTPQRLRLELAGHRARELAIPPFQFPADLVLDATGAPDGEMVRIPGGAPPEGLVGIDHIQSPNVAPYSLGRHEVTNAEFRRFVDEGGYSRPELWEHPFHGAGGELSFEEAMALFVDRTGRQGPATWEAGSYPAGMGDHPVTGVSWHEAAAYAKFAGRSLPTLFHWARAAVIQQSGAVAPISNFGGQGTQPVGASGSVNRFGTFDMAGNVREWTSTASAVDSTLRFVLGGGWRDQAYQFTDAFAQPALDRADINGIRLAQYATDDSTLVQASVPVELAFRDYTRERPVSEEIFQAYRRLYTYDAAPLDASVHQRIEEPEWIREEITFVAAYGEERVTSYLYLPKQGTPPHETVVFFPGSDVISARSLSPTITDRFDFFLKSGRAVVLPVYKGTLQRGDALDSDYQNETAFYRDHVIMWVRDLARTIDYLETRPDLSTERLAYYGISWGGTMGALVPAVESRIKVNVLYIAGLMMQPTSPEVDPWNFLPRVRQPTIMLNGRYDFFFPLETSQVPMFEALGTPAEHKRHVVADGGHDVPRDLLIRESLDWLDQYQRP